MPPVRRLQQQRALDTRQALIDAAERLFADRGWELTQTPDIAAAAGVSTGAFYRYFEDKRAILYEVLEQYVGRGRAEVSERLRPERFVGADNRAAIDVVIDVLFDLVKKEANLSRVYVGLSLTDPVVASLRARGEARDRASLAKLIELLVPRERAPDPLAAAVVIQVSALEVAAERANLRPREGRRPSDAAVRFALREMIHRFLFDDALTVTRETKKKKKKR
jgi:AcrR family transcriptional regulator